MSLADYLAAKGWDVWTCELRGALSLCCITHNTVHERISLSFFPIQAMQHLVIQISTRHLFFLIHPDSLYMPIPSYASFAPVGNGLSDKPRPLSGRSRWWTIDDHVERDVPAVLRFLLQESRAKQVHFLGHSMVRYGASTHRLCVVD